MLEFSKPSLFLESLRFTRYWPTNLSSLGRDDCLLFFGKTPNSHWFQMGSMGFLWREKTSLNFTEENSLLQQVSLKPIITQLLLVSYLTTQSPAGTFLSPKGNMHMVLTLTFTHREAVCPDCKAGRPPHDSKGLVAISQPSVAHLRVVQLSHCKIRSRSWAY